MIKKCWFLNLTRYLVQNTVLCYAVCPWHISRNLRNGDANKQVFFFFLLFSLWYSHWHLSIHIYFPSFRFFILEYILISNKIYFPDLDFIDDYILDVLLKCNVKNKMYSYCPSELMPYYQGNVKWLKYSDELLYSNHSSFNIIILT